MVHHTWCVYFCLEQGVRVSVRPTQRSSHHHPYDPAVIIKTHNQMLAVNLLDRGVRVCRLQMEQVAIVHGRSPFFCEYGKHCCYVESQRDLESKKGSKSAVSLMLRRSAAGAAVGIAAWCEGIFL
jgi:hypothetical protein